MRQTIFNAPEQLDARLEFLGRDRYHLFVNGRWAYAFYNPGTLMGAYREFRKQGHACTVVACGEIVFYSRRPEA
jgi:hypothetical protein